MRPFQFDIRDTHSPKYSINAVLHDLLNFPSLDLIYPSGNGDIFRDRFTRLQQLHVILHGLLEIGKRLKVQPSQFLLPFDSQILLDDSMRVFVFESQHPAAGVLYEEDLVCSE